MTDQTIQPQDIRVFNKALAVRTVNIPKSMAQVKQKAGVSGWRQVLEMLRLGRKPYPVDFQHYYRLGLYDPEMPWEKKLEYVSHTSNSMLCHKMSPDSPLNQRSFLDDKLLFGAAMEQLGFPVTILQAVFGAGQGLGQAIWLTDAPAIMRFLRDAAVYPVFGKPIHGTVGFGAVGIDSYSQADDSLRLTDGSSVSVEGFARQVADLGDDGYLFQRMLVQHREMTEVFGPVPAVLRIVTCKEPGRPAELLYQFIRVPGHGQMGLSENAAMAYSGACNPETGQISATFGGDSVLKDFRIDRHPLGARPFEGFHVPMMQEAVTLALRAHDCFPGHGILGWDIVIADTGPVMLEANFQPGCGTFQIIERAGLLAGARGEKIRRIIQLRSPPKKRKKSR